MNDETNFRTLLEKGDVAGARRALEHDRGLANRAIHWHLERDNVSDPLHFVSVAHVLLDAGAALESTSIFGSRALHWAAWLGSADLTALLIERGAALEPRDTEFGATPLFWAVHGFGPDGPKEKREQVRAAQLLIEAGARVDTGNRQGVTALELARTYERQEMFELLRQHA